MLGKKKKKKESRISTYESVRVSLLFIYVKKKKKIGRFKFDGILVGKKERQKMIEYYIC